MLKSTLKLFSLIFFLLTITLYSSKIIYAAEYLPIPTNTKFSLEIDREELALPAEYGKYLDTAFHTLSINNEVKGYIAGIDTISFVENNGKFIYDAVVLKAGSADSFDECGAWLNSVYKVTNEHILGWYHGEQVCDYSEGGKLIQRMAFTESFDGGKTWIKSNYPNNIVLEAEPQYLNNYNLPDNKLDDTADAKVIASDDGYFYMIYMGAGWKRYIARSKISDMGKPGTWYKYYEGAFNEPGIGGKQTLINNLNVGSSVSFNKYLKKYIGILTTGRWGFFLYSTDNNNLFNWSQTFPNQTQLPFFPQISHNTDQNIDNWMSWITNSPNTGVIYGYPTIISNDYDSAHSDKSFYVYYMKSYKGDDFTFEKYLFKRKITIHPNLDNKPFSLVAVNRYISSTNNKIYDSIDNPNPKENFTYQKNITYVLSTPDPQHATKPIYECFIPIWSEYATLAYDPSLTNWQNCKDTGDLFIRKLGYVYTEKTNPQQIALYRCFDSQKVDHFLSENESCESATEKILLGYTYEKYPNTPKYGDIDRNNVINNIDVTQLLTNLFNSTKTVEMDTNLDNKNSLLDAIYIKDFIE